MAAFSWARFDLSPTPSQPAKYCLSRQSPTAICGRRQLLSPLFDRPVERVVTEQLTPKSEEDRVPFGVFGVSSANRLADLGRAATTGDSSVTRRRLRKVGYFGLGASTDLIAPI